MRVLHHNAIELNIYRNVEVEDRANVIAIVQTATFSAFPYAMRLLFIKDALFRKQLAT